MPASVGGDEPWKLRIVMAEDIRPKSVPSSPSAVQVAVLSPTAADLQLPAAAASPTVADDDSRPDVPPADAVSSTTATA